MCCIFFYFENIQYLILDIQYLGKEERKENLRVVSGFSICCCERDWANASPRRAR